MSAVAIQPVYEQLQLEDRIVRGKLDFDPGVRVSKNSRFADSTWDWYDPAQPRHLVASAADFRLNWPTPNREPAPNLPNVKLVVPLPMIEEVKRFTYVSMVMPSLVGGKRARGARSPATLVTHARGVLHLAHELHRALGVTRWQDLQGTDLQVLQSLKHSHTLLNKLRNLRALAAPVFAPNLAAGPLKFTQADVDSVIALIEAPDIEGYDPLPDALFALLSRSAHEVVNGFLRGNDLPVLDASVQGEVRPGLKEQLDLYLTVKGAAHVEFGRSNRAANRARTNAHRKAARQSAAELGVGWRELRDYLYHVQNAALTAIFLYTGMRYSEAASLRRGCVRAVGQGFELFSTLIKHQPTNAPVDYDRWVAIPLVRDAVSVLEYLAPLHGSEWLLASFDSHEALKPMQAGTVNNKLKDFLRAVDTKAGFSDWRLHSHQFRHGLVAQLAAVKTRLPYISMQLKHLTYAEQQLMDEVPDDVTVGYGNISKNILATVTGQTALTDAKYRMAMDLYGEGKRFAGGGAEKHVARTNAFFRGAGLYGDERNEFIRQRALKGIPIVVTGFGVCGKNLADFDRLKASPPPCYGDLQCNPADCDNAVVPENRRGAIAARLRKAEFDATSAPTPDLSSYYQGLVVKYRAMLDALGAGQ